MIPLFENNNIYSIILKFILKCYVIFGIDFGYVKHKSVYSKYVLVFPSIILCVAMNYLLPYKNNFNILIITENIYVGAYILITLLFTRNNVVNLNVTVRTLQRELQYLDSKLKCFTVAEYVDKRVLIALALTICQRLLCLLTYCYLTNHCVSIPILFAVFYSVVVVIDSVTIVNAYVLYSIYQRLAILTSNVKYSNGNNTFPLVLLYRTICEVSVKYKNIFDSVVSFNILTSKFIGRVASPGVTVFCILIVSTCELLMPFLRKEMFSHNTLSRTDIVLLGCGMESSTNALLLYVEELVSRVHITSTRLTFLFVSVLGSNSAHDSKCNDYYLSNLC